MRISLSLFLLLFAISPAHAKCEFRSHVKEVYSLSGVVTTGLKELGLLNRPQVKGISVFYPIKSSEFSGQMIPGGLFLSPQVTRKLSGSTVFFDQSREMRKVLGPVMKDIQSVEM